MRKTACILLLAFIMCMMVACGSKNSQDDASISSGGGPEFDVTSRREELALKVLKSAVSDMAYTWEDEVEFHNQVVLYIREV